MCSDITLLKSIPHLPGVKALHYRDSSRTDYTTQPKQRKNDESAYLIRYIAYISLQWPYNKRDCVSNYQPHNCLLKCLFRRRSKKASKLHDTGLCGGNSPMTGEFPAQRASNAENISIWWRHHIYILCGGNVRHHCVSSTYPVHALHSIVFWSSKSSGIHIMGSHEDGHVSAAKQSIR